VNGFTVYTVSKDFGQEGEILVGVFASLKDAQAFKEKTKPITGADVRIDTWTVGEGL
jgi:hypothetical protein